MSRETLQDRNIRYFSVNSAVEMVRGALPKAAPLHVIDLDGYEGQWALIWKRAYPESMITGLSAMTRPKLRVHSDLYVGGFFRFQPELAQHVVMGRAFHYNAEELIRHAYAVLAERGLLLLEFDIDFFGKADLPKGFYAQFPWTAALISPQTGTAFFVGVKGNTPAYIKTQFLEPFEAKTRPRRKRSE